MKMRTGVATGGLTGRIPSNRGGGYGGGGGQRTMVAGQFETFWPGETPIWVAIAPTTFTYDTWDREIREVISVETTWYEVKQHYCGWRKGKPGQKSFNCSAGAHKDRACYGEAIVNAHYQEMRRIKEQTGVEPKTKPAVSTSSFYALAVVIAEYVFKLPLLDAQTGQPRKSKNGSPLFRYTPEPMVSEEVAEAHAAAVTFGHSMHWALGTEHMTQLIDWGTRLEHFCMTPGCATEMSVHTLICPECEGTKQLRAKVRGGSLSVELGKTRTCTDCGYSGQFNTGWNSYECSGCNNPTMGGGLLGFELQIQKVQTGEKSSRLDVVGVRTPTQHNPASNPNDSERMAKLVANPLDIMAIYAPTPLNQQKAMLGDDPRFVGLSPEPRGSNATATQSYAEPEPEVSAAAVDWSEE